MSFDVMVKNGKNRVNSGTPFYLLRPHRYVEGKGPSLKKHLVRPEPSLAGLAANDNSVGAVVDFVRAMPAADQTAVRLLLGADPPGAKHVSLLPPADLEAAIAAQPVEALRRFRDRHLGDAALRQKLLDERDGCYRALACA